MVLIITSCDKTLPIEGTVYVQDQDGTPLEGANVKLYHDIEINIVTHYDTTYIPVIDASTGELLDPAPQYSSWIDTLSISPLGDVLYEVVTDSEGKAGFSNITQPAVFDILVKHPNSSSEKYVQGVLILDKEGAKDTKTLKFR
jgi:hypothetical protein